MATDKHLRCSFCGKSKDAVRKFISGPSVYICNECIALCNEILAEDEEREVAEAITEVPTPADIKDVLDQYVIGQEDAKRVLAVADLTFMIPPRNSLSDNDRLISNIADFLTTGERTFALADYPHFFGDEIDILLGTLGKSLGSFGAFIAGSRALRALLINTARSFIFSCALAPPQVAAARAALEVIQREPWRREQLAQNADRLRNRLAQRGISTAPSTTHILPVIVGGNDATMKLCERLLENGIYAQGIRHPSVPEGTARLRITPMATHRSSEIDHLVDLLEKELVG